MSDPISVRVGKLGRDASGLDHIIPGDLVRLTINEFSAFGKLDIREVKKFQQELSDLRKLVISVNYELYDGIPAMFK